MKLTKLFLLIIAFFSFANIQGQIITVKGKVLDQSGLPIAGANVKTNAEAGVSTDFDGSYNLKADANSTLTFSFIGFDTFTTKISGRTTIDAKLKEKYSGLNEVVVVGYGTQKKSVVTGSISSVKAKDLQDLPITRIEQSLQGRTSGVSVVSNSGQPGTGSTIRIRGITTLNNNDPLWVVDGVIVDNNGIGIINQADIESIEVLKDAASQAIYGTRAATGVILVTTKKGKAGKMLINYNGFTGVSQVARKLNLTNAQQYATLLNESYAAAGQPIPFSGTTSPANLGEGTDWQAQIFNNNAQRTSHELSISGATEKSNYFISLGVLDQQGIIAKEISNYNRKNIRINTTHNLGKSVVFGQTLGYSRESYSSVGDTNSETNGILGYAINLDPTTPSIETGVAAGSIPYTNVGAVRDANGNLYGISSLVGQEIVNPLAFTATKLGNTNWADNFIGNAFVELQVLKDFKLKTTVGAKLAYYGFDSFTPFYYLNSSSERSLNTIQTESNRNFGWLVENTLNYNKKLGEHNFNITLGQGAYVDNIASQVGMKKNGIPTNNYQDASINFEVPLAQREGYAGTSVKVQRNSLFARLNYDYKQRYLLTGVIRRDGSDLLGENNKYGIFSSYSLGWVVTKESFWKENNYVNFLKIRGGYGVVGNDKIRSLVALSVVNSGNNYSFGNTGFISTGFSPNAPSNPDLKWEQTSQSNIGFEAVLFKNLTLTLDLYDKLTTGILQDYQLPGFIGATQNPIANLADVSNKGFEIELGYTKKIGGVNVSLKGNLSSNRNEVTNLGLNKVFLEGGETVKAFGNKPFTRTQVGHAVSEFYGFQTLGIFQNQNQIDSYKSASGIVIQPSAMPGDFIWEDINNDGKITNDDNKFLGSPLPKYTFGFTLNLDYKNFDLMLFAQGVTGNKIFQGMKRIDAANTNFPIEAMSRWTGEGTSNSYPRLTREDKNNNFSSFSNFYLQDGDYLRIKTLQIGYSLPKSFITKAGIQRTRIYITGENLFTFTKYTGFDPEIGGNILGLDKGFYPQAISYMLGVNLQF